MSKPSIKIINHHTYNRKKTSSFHTERQTGFADTLQLPKRKEGPPHWLLSNYTLSVILGLLREITHKLGRTVLDIEI